MMRTFLALMLCVGIATAQDSVKILLIGDSITELNWQGGYRSRLHRLLADSAYVFDYVGSRTTNHDTTGFGTNTWPSEYWNHEGVTGRTALTWLSTVRSVVAADTPDVVYLQIGTNDCANGSYSSTTIVSNISKMVDSIWAVNDSIRIVFSNIPRIHPTGSLWSQAKEDTIAAVNLKLGAMIEAKQRLGFFKWVDIFNALTDSADFDTDGVHPSVTGYVEYNAAIYDEVIDALLYDGDKYFTYYNSWSMGTAAQWSIGASHYLPITTFIANLGNINHVIIFNPDDNIDTNYAPYFTFDGAYVTAGGSPNDSVNFWFNGIANPQSGYASWIARGHVAQLRDSLHAHGKKIIVEVQGVTATHLNVVLADSQKTEDFTTSVSNWVIRNNIDGVDFNTESGITFDSIMVRRYFRILRSKLPTQVLTVVPVVTHWARYNISKGYIDHVLPQMYAYAENDQGGTNGVFLNSPLHKNPNPAGSNHQDITTWGPNQWYQQGWKKRQMALLISNEANPYEGIDTMFSLRHHVKTFWCDTAAYLMLNHGGTLHWDSVHIGHYITGTSDTTITANGAGELKTINQDSLFYILVLSDRNIDSVVTWGRFNGYTNFGLFDVATDARPNASIPIPRHKYMSDMMITFDAEVPPDPPAPPFLPRRFLLFRR